jgi:uncharacterized protein YcbK (DUF882 family)
VHYIALALLLLFTVSCAPTRDLSVAPDGEQRVVFRHKSGEKIDVITRSNGQYNKSAFSKIDRIFRDRHTGEEYPIDPKLIDAIADLRDKLMLSPSDPIDILSGYRSPESNAKLSKTNRYVAKHSYHMTGQAADIRITGMSSSALEAVAKTMQKGGVALYPDSGHVHVDTGPIRGWSVVRGQEDGTKQSAAKGARATYAKPPIKFPNNSYEDLPLPKKGFADEADEVKPARVPAAVIAPVVAAPIVKYLIDKKPKATKEKGAVKPAIKAEPLKTEAKSKGAVKTQVKSAVKPAVRSLEDAKKQWVKTPKPALKTDSKPVSKVIPKPAAKKAAPKKAGKK